MMVCHVWFGGQMVVGDQVTAPSIVLPFASLHTVVPVPPCGWPGSASTGTVTPTAAIAAAPRARRLLTFTDPPEELAPPRGWRRFAVTRTVRGGSRRSC